MQTEAATHKEELELSDYMQTYEEKLDVANNKKCCSDEMPRWRL